jgi:hypothetical protein
MLIDVLHLNLFFGATLAFQLLSSGNINTIYHQLLIQENPSLALA